MSTKFFIFGGGRWREVCLQTGTVSGWDNSARFVYCRGKRLQVARRHAVLAGLRALAADAPTSIRNGPRLSQRRHGSHQNMRREVSHGPCKHCCYPKSKTNTKVIEITSAAKETQTDVQVAKPVLRPVEKDCKRTGSETISHELILNKFSERTVTRKKSFIKTKQSLIKNKHTSESSNSSTESSKSIIVTPTKRQLKETVQSNHVTKNYISQNLPRSKNVRGNSTSTNESLVITPKRNNKTQSRSRVETAHTDNNRIPHQKTNNQQPSSGVKDITKFISKIIEDSSNKYHSRPIIMNKNNYKTHVIREKASSRVSMPTSDTESSEWSGAPSVAGEPSALHRHGETNICKELTIDESDVTVLRAFLEKYSSEDVLLRFDSDDSFKQTIFYSINPLVRVERCRRTTEMLQSLQRRVPDTRLADFASQLGLRSISENSSREPLRYRTRRSLAAARTLTHRNSYHEDNNKENLTDSRVKTRGEESKLTLHPRIRRSIRVLGENSPVKAKVFEKAPKPLSVDTTTVSSDSDDAFIKKSSPQKSSPQKSSPKNSLPQTVPLQNPKLQPTLKVSRRKYLLVRGYRSGVQEYSVLEDQAIVSWVSQGGRATRVKGNMVWRELCEQYHALTGQKRTWQSLRNRYLRYVLPALSKLSLPSGRAAALRAAAATGNIKNKKRSQRRNSIFDKTQVEAASSKAPPPFLRREYSDTDTESSPPRKRLRSSLVGPAKGRGAERGEEKGVTRSRKLFNPNSIL